MKLLIIGSDYSWSIERHYLKYIRLLNPETKFFAAQNRLYEYLKQNIVNKVIHRLGISSVYRNIARELLDLIDDYQPDCIWVFKGMEIQPRVLKLAKQKGIKLVNYNPDNPFIFTGRGSGNSYIRQSLGFYDQFFTYNVEIQKQLIQKTGKPVEFLPFGFDLDHFDPEEIQSLPEINNPCFLGNPDSDRASFINALNKKGLHLVLYGNNWSKFVSPKMNTIFDAVYGFDFYKVLYQYRLQLNIMRIHNLQSHNMRSFEIPAVGGIQLAPDTPEHRLFFEPGKEIMLYTSIEDCCLKINEILSWPNEKAEEFRKAAYTRCHSSAYDYRSRAGFVFNNLVKYA
jgi:spore maturation protein CgeB